MTIDPRGPRFGAGITTLVLAAALLLGPGWGLVLVVLQAAAFGAGALLGLRFQPYGWVFRKFVRPRLAAPTELEDERPPRFAQAVGLGFVVVALVGGLTGVLWLYDLALAFALAAAFLNAAFDFCLGCEIYLRIAVLRHKTIARRVPAV